jgi:hypothetical protein
MKSELGARFLGILFAPTETFTRVIAEPSWVGMLVLTSIVSAVFVGGFLSTEVGQEAWLDQALPSTESVDDAQRQHIEQLVPYLGIVGAVQVLVAAPLVSLVFAGILFIVFTVALGTTASFKQQFAVVVHSGVIGTVAQAFIWLLNYFREEMTRPTTLGLFLPMLNEESYVFRVLNVIDLIHIWWIIVLAIGLAVLYRRKATSIASSLFGVYILIALTIGAFWGGS